YEARVKIGEYSRALGNEPVAAEDDAEPETDHLVVPVVWRVFEENELQWLRLESAGIALSQVRLLNSVRTVIAISAKAIDPADVTRSSLGLVRERYPKWDNRSPAMGSGQVVRQLTLDQPIDGSNPSSPADANDFAVR